MLQHTSKRQKAEVTLYMFIMLSEMEKESSTVPGYVLGCKDENPPSANTRRATGRESEAEPQTYEEDLSGAAAAFGSGPGRQLLFFREKVTNQILLHSHRNSSHSTRDVHKTSHELLPHFTSQLWDLADSGVTYPPSSAFWIAVKLPLNC